MGSRGFVGKSIEEHKREGTYKPSLHKFDSPQALGMPIKPSDLDDVAGALWDTLTPQLFESKVVAEIDSTVLGEMCRIYSLYVAARKLAEQSPADKDIRIAVLGYWQAFERLASKFALSPGDRMRLKVVPPEAEDDDEPEFTL